MQFWRLEHPDYESDYKHSYINGSLEHPFGLPGVRCDVCHQTWGGSRILAFECPTSLRGSKHLTERWPISLEQHQALQQEVKDESRKAGITVPQLHPGDDFQPCYLDVPSRPRADFLWACLGSVLVSERVRQLFESLPIVNVSYSPVTLRKVGKREARFPTPIPSTGEPEDIVHEVPLLTWTDSVGPYFEMVIQSESGYAPGAEPLSVCSGCGRETPQTIDARFVMMDSMWKGADIFFLAGTLHHSDRASSTGILLAESFLQPYEVWHKGDVRNRMGDPAKSLNSFATRSPWKRRLLFNHDGVAPNSVRVHKRIQIEQGATKLAPRSSFQKLVREHQFLFRGTPS
jgi:hypothetical protein